MLRILFIITLLLMPTLVQAQLLCDRHDIIVTKLTKKYGEVLQSMGLSGPKIIFELYANKTTGTWTFLKTTPNGLTCLMAAGTNYLSFTPKNGTPT